MDAAHRGFFAISVLLGLTCLPYAANAATLVLEPAQSTISLGGTTQLDVRVVSDAEAINAVSATILASPEVSFTSTATQGSVVSFWVQEPIVEGDTVRFEGVVLNPGYRGSGGLIATIGVKGARAGIGTISFSEGGVYANDGEGTNVLAGMSSASVTVKTLERNKKPTYERAPIAEPPGVPTSETTALSPAPTSALHSKTHPDQNAWYPGREGTFSLSMPEGANATRYSVSDSPADVPAKTYEGGLGEVVLQDLPEGTSYLHVRHRVDGVWGPVQLFRINVDSVPPVLTRFEEQPRTSRTSGKISFFAEGEDTVSGVRDYDVTVNGVRVQKSASGAYEVLLPPGLHVAVASLTDHAGNTLTRSLELGVVPLQAPLVTFVPERISSQETSVITGTALPGVAVTALFFPIVEDVQAASAILSVVASLSTQEAAAEVGGTVASDGTFALSVPALRPGSYDVWVFIRDTADGQSVPVGPSRLVVERAFAFGALVLPTGILLVLAALFGAVVFLWKARLYLPRIAFVPFLGRWKAREISAPALLPEEESDRHAPRDIAQTGLRRAPAQHVAAAALGEGATGAIRQQKEESVPQVEQNIQPVPAVQVPLPEKRTVKESVRIHVVDLDAQPRVA